VEVFVDTKGKQWELAITVGAIKRVRGLLEIDLTDLTGPRSAGGDPLMTELQLDLVLLVDVIYVICKPQADEADISDEQFAELLAGGSIYAARQAFWEALLDFFHQVHRQDQAKAIQKQMRLVDAMVNKTSRDVDAIDLDGLLNEASSANATGSPASPASAPTN